MRRIERPDGTVEIVLTEDALLDLLDTGAVERLTPEEWQERMKSWERLAQVNERLERKGKKKCHG